MALAREGILIPGFIRSPPKMLPTLSHEEVQLGVFPSLRMRPEGISHTFLVLCMLGKLRAKNIIFIVCIPDRIGEKRILLNNILRRKANWNGHILGRHCVLRDAIEGQMTEVKGVEKRRTQLLDDLRNRKIF